VADFNQTFQLDTVGQQGNVLGSTAYVAEGYFPINVTVNPMISSGLDPFISSLDSAGAVSAVIDPYQTTDTSTSVTTSDSQQDDLLGMTLTTALVGDDIRIEAMLGRRNRGNESW
jgi:hypothetical protein